MPIGQHRAYDLGDGAFTGPHHLAELEKEEQRKDVIEEGHGAVAEAQAKRMRMCQR
jgi:hypothetical protein